MGRFIIRLVPWWLFALIGLSFLPLTLTTVEDTLETHREIAQARIAPQPAPQPLHLARLSHSASIAGEINITARWRRDLGVRELELDGVNHSYALLQSTAPPKRLLALYVPSYQDDRLEAVLNGLAQDGDLVTLGGFLPRHQSRFTDLRRDIAQRAIAGDATVITPMMETRAEGLDALENDGWLIAGIAVVFQIAFFGAAIVKFRRWRKRRALARDQKPTPPPKPAAKQQVVRKPAAPKVAADPYADSPIQTHLGWFR
ncbi:hypothetical protein [Yoonia sp. 208BN28-4]|uniref:hypothetical protein n=1 Tax=Yoonia sp. 208BN28-4 TaxID=3126505 RepID=UPI0030AADA8A